MAAAFIDNVKGSGMINSEAKLHALCFLASHVSKQVNSLQSIPSLVAAWFTTVYQRMDTLYLYCRETLLDQ